MAKRPDDSDETHDIDQLKTLSEPKLLAVNNEITMCKCDEIWNAVVRSKQTTMFRVHPFPENVTTSERCSVREHECAYVQATVAHFIEWQNVTRHVDVKNPFHAFSAEQFWAYCDYKEVTDLLSSVECDEGGIFSWDIVAASSNHVAKFSNSKIWIVSDCCMHFLNCACPTTFFVLLFTYRGAKAHIRHSITTHTVSTWYFKSREVNCGDCGSQPQTRMV